MYLIVYSFSSSNSFNLGGILFTTYKDKVEIYFKPLFYGS